MRESYRPIELNDLPMSTIVCLNNGEIEEANNLALLDIAVSSLKGRNINEFLVEKVFNKLGKSDEFLYFKNSEQAIFPVRLSLKKMKSASLVSWVTLPKQTEKQVFAPKVLEIFNSAFLCVTLQDYAGKYIDVNQAFCRFIGYRANELLKFNFKEVTHPDDREIGYIAIAEGRKKGLTSFQFEKRYLHKDGSILWGRTTLVIGKSGDPQTDLTVSIIEDVTEQRKYLGISWQEAENFFKTITEGLPFGCLLWQKDRPTYANPAMYNIYGLEHGNWLELERNLKGDYLFFVHPDDKNRLLNAKNDILSLVHAGRTYYKEVRLKNLKTGAYRWYSLNFIEKTTLLGPLYLSIFEDIHDKKLMDFFQHKRNAILEAASYAATWFLAAKDWEVSLYDGIKNLGNAAGVSHVFLFQNMIGSQKKNFAVPTCEWHAENVEPLSSYEEIQHFNYANLGLEYRIESFIQKKTICTTVDMLPPLQQKFFQRFGILSFAVVPIFVNNIWWGFITLDDCINNRDWSEAEMDALYVMAQALGAAIQRKEAEEAKNETEQKFISLVRQSRDGISIVNEKGLVIEWNKGQEEITGISDFMALGKPIWDIQFGTSFPEKKTKDNYEKIKNLFVSFLYKEEKHPFYGMHEMEFAHRDGSKHIMQTTIFPIKTRKEFMLAMISRDVTEQKAFQAELQKKEAQNQAIFRVMPDFIFITDRDCIFREFKSEEPEEMLISPILYQDRPLKEYFPLDVAEIFEEMIKKAFVSERVLSFEYEHDKGDFIQHFEARLIALDMEEVLVIIREITDRAELIKNIIQAKNEAQEAAHIKSEFLANMSHEIRTPLNSILGFAELLSSQLTDLRQITYLEAINTSGHNLLTLINDILDLSKIEAARMELHTAAVNPYKLFEDMKNIFAAKIHQKKLTFSFQIENGIPESLLLDETRVRQILFNLIGNAVKFTEKGFIRLSVSTKLHAAHKSTFDLIIAVEDTGIGIPQEAHKSIFEPFKQLDSAISAKLSGTGLGLSITKRLVEMMGGEIFIDSEPNRGSKFTIFLRNVEVASVPANTDTTEEEYVEFFESGNILLVDDIASNRLLVRDILRETPLTVWEATNGNEALEMVDKHKFDIIIMDIKMPGMNGTDAVKKIKENLRDIPIIALTASLNGKGNMFFDLSNFDRYLLKPVRRSDLLRELAYFINQRTKKRSLMEISQIGEKEILDLDANIINSIKDRSMPLWEEVMQSRSIKAIQMFAKFLEEEAEKHNLATLKEYAQRLAKFAFSFDIKNLKPTLEEYPSLLATLGLHN